MGAQEDRAGYAVNPLLYRILMRNVMRSAVDEEMHRFFFSHQKNSLNPVLHVLFKSKLPRNVSNGIE
jgi:hypothetical protein